MSAPSKKYRIFLSSTGEDLRDERAAILRLFGSSPWIEAIAQENFSILPEHPIDACRERVASADLFVGIVGHRRGSEIEGDPLNRSFTELEFDAAVESRKTRFMCVQPDEARVKQSFRDRDEIHERQRDFRKRVLQQHVVGRDFDNPDRLAGQVLTALFSYVWLAAKAVTSNASLPAGVTKSRGAGLVLAPEAFSSKMLAPAIVDVDFVNEQQAKATPIAEAIEALLEDGSLPQEVLEQDPESLELGLVTRLLDEAGQKFLGASKKSRMFRPFVAGTRDHLREKSSRYFVHLSVVFELSDDAAALSALRMAETIAPIDIRSRTKLGELLMRNGQLADALKIFETLASEERDNTAFAATLSNLGTIQRQLGLNALAAHAHERALELEKKFGRPMGIASQLVNLALARRADGHLQSAAKLFQEAIPHFQEAANLSGVATCNVGLALLAQYVLSLGGPCSYLDDARQIYENLQAAEPARQVGLLQAQHSCS